MANADQLALLKQGSMVWNNWRVKNLNVHIDLNKANLNGADLNHALLMHADLTNARLQRANLRQADCARARLFGASLEEAILSRATFDHANLSSARLRKADLWEARLDGADLAGADLRDANLRGVHLAGSNLSWALLDGTIFGNSDLSEVVGLDIVDHAGPSSISTDAIVLSKGNIPDVFLRGCGLSDWEIEFAKLYQPGLNDQQIEEIVSKIRELRTKQPFQVIRLFISYSHADGEFVNKLEAYLTERGIRCWRDNHELKAGRMEPQIERAIREYQKVLLVLSSSSIRSDWVEHEVRTARELEKEIERDVLCPVALDDSWKASSLRTWPKRIMEQVKEYFVIDFSAWEDDNKFEMKFGKLIDGLALFYKG
jgi:hypothetical protein